MTTIHGILPARFDEIGSILSDSIESGGDLGASAAVAIDGELVVDVWGGWADADRTQPWAADTIVNLYSSTKTMTNLCALILADRGQLDVDAPVATYWPEFAANGKDGVLVRHVLSHTSGVAGWEQPIEIEDLYDWDASVARLAAQAPWWEPGTASGYHAQSQGHLVGELVRRIDGRSLGRFLADELAGPLGADFHIGLPASCDERVTRFVVPEPGPSPESPRPDIQAAIFTGPMPRPDTSWSTAWRRAEMPAANGHGNARSLARVQAVVSNGGSVDGRRFLTPATIERILDVQADGIDLAFGVPLRFGIGYALPSAESAAWLPDGRICFWCGFGGSLVINDLDRRTTIAFAMNQHGPGVLGKPSSQAIVAAVYRALD